MALRVVISEGLKGEAFNNFEGPVNVLEKTCLMAITVYCIVILLLEKF